MKKIVEWLKKSNRWKHLAGGCIIGLGADSHYCAAYAGIAVAGALELKDKMYGNKWDWTDFALTVAGAAAGRAISVMIWNI